MRPTNKSLLNLKPYPKGVSGNPKGRPKKIKEIPELKPILGEVLSKEINGKPVIMHVIEKLVTLALNGDLAAIKELLNRVYGTPKVTLINETTEQPTIIVSSEKSRDLLLKLSDENSEK